MKSDDHLYVDKVLNLYLDLPETPSRTSRHDRQLAYRLYREGVSLETVEAAFLLGTVRRMFRDPSYPALGPIRSLHYFLPIIQEVMVIRLPKAYVQYLRHKLASHLPQNTTP